MIRDLCVMLEYIPCTYGIICVYYVHIFMCSFFVIMYVILLNYSFMCFLKKKNLFTFFLVNHVFFTNIFVYLYTYLFIYVISF